MKIEWDGSRRYQGPFVEAAILGMVEVGVVQISPSDGGRRLAVWICHLDPKPEWKTAYTVVGAKAALEAHVAEWIKKAGLVEQGRVAA